MSGPTDRSIDPRDPLAYAPKWARDLAMAERHNTGKQPSVSELADFFRRDSAEGRSADYVAATDRYPALPSLDPFGLPPPSTHRLARFSLGVAALAIAAAAIAALLLTVGKSRGP